MRPFLTWRWLPSTRNSLPTVLPRNSMLYRRDSPHLKMISAFSNAEFASWKSTVRWLPTMPSGATTLLKLPLKMSSEPFVRSRLKIIVPSVKENTKWFTSAEGACALSTSKIWSRVRLHAGTLPCHA